MSSLFNAQHLVASLEQMRDLGLADSRVRKRAAAGHLHRVHRGVYSLVPPQLMTFRPRYMAAQLACGLGAVLSHRSAAHLHEIRPTERTRIDVTVPNRSGRQHPGIEIHRSTTLCPADVTTVDGIPVTTVTRTLADLAAVLPERAVERAIERAAHLEILDGNELDDQIGRHPRGAVLERLARAKPIAAPTESELEERMITAYRAAGASEPERQVWLDPGDGGPMVRADFVWRERRAVVEVDGFRFHGSRKAFESDRRRDQRLTLANWNVVRITWRQLVYELPLVIALLAKLVGEGRATA